MSVEMKADIVPGAEAYGTKIVPVVEEESNHKMKVIDVKTRRILDQSCVHFVYSEWVGRRAKDDRSDFEKVRLNCLTDRLAPV